MSGLKHRLEYGAFRAALGVNRLLGDGAAARVGATLGRLGYPLGIRRDVTVRNLRIAFPDRDEAWIRGVARASYAHLGRETLAMLRLSHATPEALIRRTDVDPGAELFQRFREGRGLVVVAGHFGNWEIGAACVAARGYPVDVIAKRAANPLFYEHILAARARLGLRVIDMQAARTQALRALRRGRIVAFAADQYAGRAGIPVPFFGRPTPMYRGPAVMALRSGASMGICLPIRLPDGRYRIGLEMLEVESTGDLERDVARMTTAWAARLESAIRETPEQYLWQHRRWRGGDTAGAAAAADEEPDADDEV